MDDMVTEGVNRKEATAAGVEEGMTDVKDGVQGVLMTLFLRDRFTDVRRRGVFSLIADGKVPSSSAKMSGKDLSGGKLESSGSSRSFSCGFCCLTTTAVALSPI